MNRTFDKKTIKILSILTFGLMNTAANGSSNDYTDLEDETSCRQSVFNALLNQQLQMQRLYNQPILQFFADKHYKDDCKLKEKTATKKATSDTRKLEITESAVVTATIPQALDLKKKLQAHIAVRAETKQDGRKILTKSESKQSCITKRPPHWLLSHIQNSEQEIQQQNQKIDQLLQGIYGALKKSTATTYGIVSGDHEDINDGKINQAAEDAIKKATGNDQAVNQIKAIGNIYDLRVKAYDKLEKIYKDDSSSEQDKRNALSELQAAVIVAEKLNDSVLKMMNVGNSNLKKAYQDLVTYFKEHAIAADTQELATYLAKVYLAVHVNQAILSKINQATDSSDIGGLRSQLIEGLHNNNKEEAAESLKQLVLTTNFGTSLLAVMEQYKESYDKASFSNAYHAVLNDFKNRELGFVSATDQEQSMKKLIIETVNLCKAFEDNDYLERAKQAASMYDIEIN